MPEENDEEKKDITYLGDGAYVEFIGFEFIIYADREGVRHWVSLEPGMIEKLYRLMKHRYPD